MDLFLLPSQSAGCRARTGLDIAAILLFPVVDIYITCKFTKCLAVQIRFYFSLGRKEISWSYKQTLCSFRRCICRWVVIISCTRVIYMQLARICLISSLLSLSPHIIYLHLYIAWSSEATLEVPVNGHVQLFGYLYILWIFFPKVWC